MVRNARPSLVLCVGGLLLSLNPGLAHTQERTPTTVFSGGLGAGVMSCSECFQDWSAGVSGYATVGREYGRHTIVGLELGTWARREDGVTVYRLDYLATLRHTPVAEDRLSLKIGAGVTTLNVSLPPIGTARETAFAVTAGASWSFAGDRALSWQVWTDGTYALRHDRTYSAQAGFGITWR